MSEDWDNNIAKPQPNTWLTSNSNLYLADAILSDKVPLNAYSMFDLSTLAESILLANKIAVLPGIGVYSDTGKFLKNNGILEVVDDYRKRDLFDLISEVRGQAPDDLLNIIDKGVLAEIFCHTFGITKERALKALQNTTDWVVEKSDSPMWSNWFSQAPDHQFLELNPGQDFISEVFWRTILYLCVGSLRGYNYYPDSIRVPIVAYILRQIQDKIKVNPVGQELIDTIEKGNGRLKEKYSKMRSARNWIEIDIPAALTYILKACSSKADFLNEAIKLRKNKHVKNCRHWIANLDEAIRSNNAGEYMTLLDTVEEISKEGTLQDKTPFYVEMLPSLSVSPTSAGASIPTDRIARRLHKYLKYRRLAFFSDLSKCVKQVGSINPIIERVFRSSIPKDQLKRFSELRAYQAGYLSAVLEQNIANYEPIPTTNENINIAKKRLADGSISIDEYDEILGRLKAQ